jgi:hypothetical protein
MFAYGAQLVNKLPRPSREMLPVPRLVLAALIFAPLGVEAADLVVWWQRAGTRE